MKLRLLLSIIGTLIAALLLVLVPDFNWAGNKELSMLQQYTEEGRILQLVEKIGVLAMFIFIGLLFLIRFNKETQEEL